MNKRKAYQINYTIASADGCPRSVRSVLVIAYGIMDAAQEAENGRKPGEDIGIGEVSTPVVVL